MRNKKVLVHIHARARFLTGYLLAARERHLALVVARRDEIVFFCCSQVGHDFLFEELATHLCWIAHEGLAGVFITPVGCVMKFHLANVDGGGGGLDARRRIGIICLKQSPVFRCAPFRQIDID